MAEFIKPRLAKGTRDFSPEEMRLRNHIIEVIKSKFSLYGFEQIETPAVENLETLTGKYGDEGDKLIFKILNSGDYLKDADENLLTKKDSEKLISSLCEKALRYDLTVPFARYVVQHRNDINFPFRRFQIQPVWRADRPQKGRYREFYQCDADVIGSNSLLLEAEFINLIDNVLKDLAIDATIKLNSRKILYGFCQENGIEEKFTAFTTVLDKMDKKPWEDLVLEFKENGLTDSVISSITQLKGFSGKAFSKENILGLSKMFKTSEIGKEGVQELLNIASYLEKMPTSFVSIELDITLARGLNYYTGAIIEVVSNKHKIGSICGGGRYDDLTGIFGMPEISGIGISFGIDRIFDILSIQGWKGDDEKITVMLANFGEDVIDYNLEMLYKLREAGISAEIFPDGDKLKKQFKYADQKKFNYVLIAGSNEKDKSIFSLKNLRTGDQKEMDSHKVISFLLNS